MEGEQGSGEGDEGEQLEAGAEVAGGAVEQSDEIGAEEAAEVGEGVDEPDAACGGGAGEELRGQGPEGPVGAEDAGHCDRQEHDGNGRGRRERTAEEAEGGG